MSDFRYVEVYNENGKQVSDHAAAECDFTFIKTPDFIENTQTMQIVKAEENTFLYRVEWFFKALFMILSDLINLPELIKEFV